MGKRILPYSSWVAPDFVPETFGRLTTVSSRYRPEGCRDAIQDYSCSCGKEVSVRASTVRRGDTRSCGCLNIEMVVARSKTHGHNKSGQYTPEITAYRTMIDRCYNRDCPQYGEWGGRGIRVFPEWLGPGGFERWLAHIGPRPGKGYSQDRKENDGNYEPGNVRWATAEEQANNRRNNVWLTHENTTKTLAQWARIVGIHESTIKSRLCLGWAVVDALTLPPKYSNRNPQAKTPVETKSGSEQNDTN